MDGLGFINLPVWSEALRKNFKKLGLDNLLNSPVLLREENDGPWIGMEEAEFFSAVNTGFHFSEKTVVKNFPPQCNHKRL